MILMPRCCAARGVGMSTSAPPRRIRPASLWYTPARIFMSVDLPAPFSPTSAWISPRRSSKRQLRSAWTPGKSLLIPSISTSRSPTASGTHTPRDGPGPSPIRDGPVRFLYFVRVEDAFEVRVRLQDRLREIGGLQLVAAAVLRRDDLDVRVLVLDLIGEALHAIDAGAAGLVVRDDRDFTGTADERGHLVRRRACGRDVVGGRGRERDVAVDAGVEPDHRNLGVLELLKQRDRRLAVERRKAQRRWLLVEHGLQHFELLVDLRLVLRSLEIDSDVELRRGLLGSLLHGLPELVLKALRDERDECLSRGAGAGATGGRCATASGGDKDDSHQTAEPTQ